MEQLLQKEDRLWTYINGKWRMAMNHCDKPEGYCTRMNAQSGQDYKSCGSFHAEAQLASMMTKNGELSDGVAWLVGHYWACEPCASALKSVGVKEIRIRETL